VYKYFVDDWAISESSNGIWWDCVVIRLAWNNNTHQISFPLWLSPPLSPLLSVWQTKTFWSIHYSAHIPTWNNRATETFPYITPSPFLFPIHPRWGKSKLNDVEYILYQINLQEFQTNFDEPSISLISSSPFYVTLLSQFSIGKWVFFCSARRIRF